MIRFIHDTLDWLSGLFGLLDILVTILSLLYVMKLFRSNLRHYKYYKYVAIIDCRVLSKILYNYETELYKYFLLGLVLLFELTICIFVALSIIFLSHWRHHYHTQFKVELNSTYFNCTKSVFDIKYPIGLLLVYPVFIVVPLLFTLLYMILLQLFSFLCTYLKWRYCGYSLDNRVVSKYVVWWCVQAALLFLCATPYTQILLAVVCPIMLLINWTLLVAESRRLSRAIRSVLYEIKHFECDDVRYRASYASYRTYRIFISIQMFALLAVVILFAIFCCECIIHYFILIQCNPAGLRYLHFEITPHILEVSSEISNFISSYFAYVSLLLFELVNISPSVLLCLIYLSRYFSKKIKLLKYDRHLSQPLI